MNRTKRKPAPKSTADARYPDWKAKATPTEKLYLESLNRLQDVTIPELHRANHALTQLLAKRNAEVDKRGYELGMAISMLERAIPLLTPEQIVKVALNFWTKEQ
jgi:hypothetical protein